MSNFMYAATVPPIIRSLTNLRSILEKAEAYERQRKLILPFCSMRVFTRICFHFHGKFRSQQMLAKERFHDLPVWSRQNTKTMK